MPWCSAAIVDEIIVKCIDAVVYGILFSVIENVNHPVFVHKELDDFPGIACAEPFVDEPDNIVHFKEG